MLGNERGYYSIWNKTIDGEHNSNTTRLTILMNSSTQLSSNDFQWIF